MKNINIKIVPKSACRPKPQPSRLLVATGVILAVIVASQLVVFIPQPSWAASMFGTKSKDTTSLQNSAPTQKSVAPPTTKSTLQEQCKDLEPYYPCDNVPPALKPQCVLCYLDNVRDKAAIDAMKKRVEYFNSMITKISGLFGGSGGGQINLPGGSDGGSSNNFQQPTQPDQQLIEPPANNSLEQWRSFMAYYANLIWQKWAQRVQRQKACTQATKQRNQCLEQEFDKRWQASVQPIQAACEAQVRHDYCHIIRRNGKDIEDCSGLDKSILEACKKQPPKGYLCPAPISLPGQLSPDFPSDLGDCTSKQYWLAQQGWGKYCCPAIGGAPKSVLNICPCGL